MLQLLFSVKGTFIMYLIAFVAVQKHLQLLDDGRDSGGLIKIFLSDKWIKLDGYISVCLKEWGHYFQPNFNPMFVRVLVCNFMYVFILLKEALRSHFQVFRHKKVEWTHILTSFQSSGVSKFRLQEHWSGCCKGRHGSVIPVLAENPNYPEEQSAVVMCGQNLKTNLSSPAPTWAPLANRRLSPEQDRQTETQTDRQRDETPDSSHCNDVGTSQNSSVRGASSNLSSRKWRPLITNHKLKALLFALANI